MTQDEELAEACFERLDANLFALDWWDVWSSGVPLARKAGEHAEERHYMFACRRLRRVRTTWEDWTGRWQVAREFALQGQSHPDARAIFRTLGMDALRSGRSARTLDSRLLLPLLAEPEPAAELLDFGQAFALREIPGRRGVDVGFLVLTADWGSSRRDALAERLTRALADPDVALCSRQHRLWGLAAVAEAGPTQVWQCLYDTLQRTTRALSVGLEAAEAARQEQTPISADVHHIAVGRCGVWLDIPGCRMPVPAIVRVPEPCDWQIGSRIEVAIMDVEPATGRVLTQWVLDPTFSPIRATVALRRRELLSRLDRDEVTLAIVTKVKADSANLIFAWDLQGSMEVESGTDALRPGEIVLIRRPTQRTVGPIHVCPVWTPTVAGQRSSHMFIQSAKVAEGIELAKALAAGHSVPAKVIFVRGRKLVIEVGGSFPLPMGWAGPGEAPEVGSVANVQLWCDPTTGRKQLVIPWESANEHLRGPIPTLDSEATGIVVSRTDYGLFVALGAYTGLLHFGKFDADMHHHHIAVGDAIRVRVAAVEPERMRISFVPVSQAAPV